jgi:hypothetical protein
MSFFYELYDNNTEEISRKLGKTNWLLLSSEANEPLALGQETILFNLAVWKNTRSSDNQFIYLYHKANISNYLEMITSEKCYLALLAETELKHQGIYDSKIEGDNIQSEFVISETKHVIFRQQYKNGYTYYVICYNPVQINEILQDQRSSKMQEQLIYQQKKDHIEYVLSHCKSLAQKDDYETALAILDTLKGFLPEYDEEISHWKEKYREEVKKQRIATMTAQAEELFEDRNLQEALKVYENIQRIDRENHTASIRVSQIKKMLDVLYLRSDIMYDYKVLSPDSWHLINNQLEAEINQTIKRGRNGSLDFYFTVYMDTIGRNSSFYHLNKNTDVSFDKFLKELSTSTLLKPTYKESISVASQYKFTHKVDWHSFEFGLQKKKNVINISSEYKYLLNNDAFKRVINDSTMPRGRYVFEIKEKKVNTNPVCVDVSLTKYKVVGREAFFYSLLLPGVGTMAATQGQKGYLSFIGFFTAGALGLAAYLQSQRLDDYAESFKGNDTEKYNEMKKAAKNVALGAYIGFGVTGTIYITEAFRAMAKGGKNMKASKALRRSIKNDTREIITQDIRL